jgi:IS30 family transposase
VDRGWLERRLTEGASFEAIGRELGADPSTVAYWARKHSLASSFAARHTERGGLERARLKALVADGLTVREIAAAVDRTQPEHGGLLAQALRAGDAERTSKDNRRPTGR